MSISQKIYGWFNNQSVVNNNTIVDEKYIQQLITFQSNPSDINQIVLSLYNSLTEVDTGQGKRRLPPEIDVKIAFNQVISYKLLIEASFSENSYFLDAAYDALDSDTPGRKKTVLNYLNILYLTVLGEKMKDNPNLDKIEVVRANSDNILFEVINRLLMRVSKNLNGITHIPTESIEITVIAIVCHAFVDCKILENPNK